ncbi:unnamed protein product [Tuwongella immobilis]|uniref:Uncharacterized protein n=1 Tax=Tuwongella immobilis TaxID=692036 RepID=A0A6C2YH13_9BACT|nr:unnamed protein product [Tuwongella immobilis]VTR96970.1 unnamed protein product [Tuwongella immobilis]
MFPLLENRPLLPQEAHSTVLFDATEQSCIRTIRLFITRILGSGERRPMLLLESECWKVSTLMMSDFRMAGGPTTTNKEDKSLEPTLTLGAGRRSQVCIITPTSTVVGE